MNRDAMRATDLHRKIVTNTHMHTKIVINIIAIIMTVQ